MKEKKQSGKENSSIEKDIDDESSALLEYSEYYEKHKEELHCIWKVTDICNVITLIGVILFFMFLIIKLTLTGKEFSWFLLLIPSVITIASHVTTLNLFIRSLELDNDKKSWVEYLLINATASATLTYLVLFCMRMEDKIGANWMQTSIPLFVAISLLSLYLLFILPQYIVNRSYFEISVVGLYALCVMFFTYLIHHKMDYLNSPDEPTFAIIFTSLFLAVGWHLVYCFYYIFTYRSENLMKKSFLMIGIIFLVTGLILTVLLLEKVAKIQVYIPVGILLLSSVFFTIFYLYKFISIEDTNRKDEDNIKV